MVKVDFTLNKFPVNGALRDACSLPFGCVIQPYAKLENLPQGMPAMHEVERCSNCYAYMNGYCMFGHEGWLCSLCGNINALGHLAANRYAPSAVNARALPELQSTVYEAVVDTSGPLGWDERACCPSGPAPVYIALVDTACSGEALGAVVAGLTAALEALPPAALFGLITYSDKVCLHDVHSPVPAARSVPVSESHPPLAVPLADVMPLTALLARVGADKATITAALEALTPDPDFGAEGADVVPAPEQQGPMDRALPASPPSPASPPRPKRAFGPALLGVLEYLQAVQHPPFRPLTPAGGGGPLSEALPPVQSPVRLSVFMAGPPDLGAGKLLVHRQQRPGRGIQAQPSASGGIAEQGDEFEEAHHWLEDVPTSSVSFYRQAAVTAASLGCCVDVYAVSPEAVGLSILSPLSNSTGGAMYLYASAEESALPQDVYKRLSGGAASSGLLRIRTSTAFKPTRTYGRLYADGSVESLHHVVSMCEGDAFAVDFDFTGEAGFDDQDAPATLQVAFQYTAVVPLNPTTTASTAASTPLKSDAQPTNGGEGGAGQPQQPSAPGGPESAAGVTYVLQRRLRVGTFRVMATREPTTVLRHSQPEAVTAAIMHKVLRVAHAQGPSRARLLLRDWLAALTSAHHSAQYPAARGDPEALLPLPVDTSFSATEALQPLPRMVYALLRSPLLSPAVEGQHPDLQPFLEHCWTCLPPGELVRAVYPVLTSYNTPDEVAVPRHTLSRGALLSPGSGPIFLLDAYIVVIVLYSARCPPDIPFPPPQNSALRKALAAIRHGRRITPMVKVVRQDPSSTGPGASAIQQDPDVDLFFHLLLDDDAEGEAQDGQGQGGGLMAFLEHMRQEVVAHLRQESVASGRQG